MGSGSGNSGYPGSNGSGFIGYSIGSAGYSYGDSGISLFLKVTPLGCHFN
ncbi:Uncharacterised protein [Legionella moravica]|uniref:Uncharacterized protein n=1 Tax=Legionella moravica TaxID=39962 RepID=A0A378JXT2_9GAMM|nr:Uncharacterised protein [Legionella moravica]